MKRLLVFFVVLLASVGIGLLIKRDPGLLLLVYHKWSIEMPLWLAALLLLVAYGGLRLLVRTVSLVGAAPLAFLEYWRGVRGRRGQVLTQRGFIALVEGRWRDAERYLMRGARGSESALLNYLGAAKAAEAQGNPERRDHCLHLAHACSQSTDLAVGLTQAKLQLSHGQLEQGLATLRHLNHQSPQHPYILKLLLQLYIALKDWDNVLITINQLKAKKVLDKAQLLSVQRQAHQGLLARAARVTEHPEQALSQAWEAVPKALRYDADMLASYARYLLVIDHSAPAEPLLRDVLKQTWDDTLITLYGLVRGQNSSKQQEVAEKWLHKHGENAVLFLCLGRLSIRNGLWDKAKAYLQSSLDLKPSPEAYLALGEVLMQLKEDHKAQDCYQKGLQLAVNLKQPVSRLEKKHLDKTALLQLSGL